MKDLIWDKDFIDKIHCADCLDFMRQMPDGCIPLIIADPPYNIGKASWDKIDNYLEWCLDWLKACERILADNGSFYMFHNHMPTIAKLMGLIEVETGFVFKQLITWDKWHNRFKKGNDLQGAFWKIINNPGLRNYPQMAEYCLFYTFQDETGLSQVYNNRDCFRGIKEYMRAERQAAKVAGYDDKTLRRICGVSLKGGGLMSHFWGDAQWMLPTADMYAKLQATGYFQRPYEELRLEYEELRLEYEELRYTFIPNGRTSIWPYPIPSSIERLDHPTQKPVDLIANIILHSSNECDLICDPFIGSGTTAIAAIRTNRRYIGIEKDEGYCTIARERIRIEQNQLKLPL